METVLITGASSGIGYELAKIYSQNNYNLILVARRKEKLEILKKEILEKINKNIKITIIERDLSKNNSSFELYNEIKNKNLEVNILINNAGIGIYGKFLNFSKEEMEKNNEMTNLNITTLVELTKLYLNEFSENGNKNKIYKILNVASIAGFLPGPLMANYYATKSYVVSFTEAIREEIISSGIKNIKISLLCPGPTSTEFEKSSNAEKSGIFTKLKVMTPEKVAKITFNKFNKGKEIIIPGIFNKISVFTIRFLPRKVVVKMARKIQEKK